MDITEFEARRAVVETSFGDIAYADVGEGPAALFVHGLMMSGALWRHVISEVAGLRRCLAIDLLGHGHTRVREGQEVTLAAQAEMLAAFCDALGLERVDLVANDFGGAVSQTFAVADPERLRSLTFTNCDAHDNLGPPAPLAQIVPLADRGHLAPLIASMLDDPSLARAHFPGTGFEDPALLTAEELHALLGPAFSSPDGGRHFEHMLTSIRGDELTKIEPRLRALTVPTLMVWGTHDTYFAPYWGHWLRDAIPGATAVIEIEGAKLFHPFERPQQLATALLGHWAGAS
jgi:pimeloyl-ACP methyl ester carboxylesterase